MPSDVRRLPGGPRGRVAQRSGLGGGLRLGGPPAVPQRRGDVWERDAGSPRVGDPRGGE